MTAASNVKNFHSIVTLIVFILTNAIVVFPFRLSLPLPIALVDAALALLSKFRILVPRWTCGKPSCICKLPSSSSVESLSATEVDDATINSDLDERTIGTMENRTNNLTERVTTPSPPKWTRLKFPINFATAPVIAVLFLLVSTAIHRKEVRDGILGSDGIVPISVMAFFFALAYIAISLDQTGLIRFLSVWVLRKGGHNGRLLYLYLYSFYIALGTLFGNDPVVLSATPFIAYMTTAAVNIKNPRAWIYAQFAAANVASAILVSANPTNLVLSGAFNISYVTYTANMIVPVVVTFVVLFPVLLYLVFPSKELIPDSIQLHALPGEVPPLSEDAGGVETARGVTSIGMVDLPVQAETGSTNPLLITAHQPTPRHRRRRNIHDTDADSMNLAELLDPHVDRRAAIFCLILFVVTLAVLLATNAAGGKVQVYAITIPAAAVMLARDMIDDWLLGRGESDEGDDVEGAYEGGSNCAQRDGDGNGKVATATSLRDMESAAPALDTLTTSEPAIAAPECSNANPMDSVIVASATTVSDTGIVMVREKPDISQASTPSHPHAIPTQLSTAAVPYPDPSLPPDHTTDSQNPPSSPPPTSVETLLIKFLSSVSGTFPLAYKVMSQLPFPLLPFTFGMFILVQGLVTKGWVEIFANGWEEWVSKTGTLGAVGGMACISVLLCNFAGTNIGATIVMSRVLQQWLSNHSPSERTRDASIYALALGVNYGAFSLTFNASLAGLLWRSILARKGIHVRAVDFARYNNPLIWCSMIVGCAVLAAQVYVVKAG
ncbi:hypothetical protein DL93DRAFT_1795316 [Clavulina sp. PMI_390]|nr:hypothetical protein DL93DRAFT_1795316 [Clavulina sp. PMI_390]